MKRCTVAHYSSVFPPGRYNGHNLKNINRKIVNNKIVKWLGKKYLSIEVVESKNRTIIT